jgi:AcrR family transcriptional regulator
MTAISNHPGTAEVTAEVPTPSRGRPRSTAVDDAIILAACELLIEGGSRELTMLGVAQRAKISTASLYRRFDSINDLLVAIAAQPSEAKPAIRDTGTLSGDLTQFTRNLVALFRGDTAAIAMALLGEALHDPELAERLRVTLVSARREETRRIFERALARGEAPYCDDPDLILDMIVGTLFYRVAISEGRVDSSVADAIVAAILRAVGAPSPV